MEEISDEPQKREYNARKEIKKEIYKKQELYLLEIFPSDLKNLTEILTLKLREAGVKI